MNKAILVATSAMLLAVATQAQASGFYLGFNAGVNMAPESDNSIDADLRPLGAPLPGNVVVDTTVDHDIGGAFIATAGYEWASGLRVEGEIGYRINGLDMGTLQSIDASGVGGPVIGGIGIGAELSGSVQNLSFMANAAYSFDIGAGGLRPYVGAGIGMALLMADASINIPAALGAPVSEQQIVDDSATVFAYQVKVGVEYPIAEQWTMGLEYRYFGTVDPNYDDNLDVNALSGAPPGTIPEIPLSVDSSYASHSVTLGVRYSF